MKQCAIWKRLRDHFQELKQCSLKELFAQDAQRAQRFSIRWGPVLFDFSKNLIDQKTVDLLCSLARELGLAEKIRAMFAGERLNITEGRSVLHVALRNMSGQPIMVDGQDVMPGVRAVLAQMEDFVNQVRSGQRLGAKGERITDVVNIGIGGSDLGPRMVTRALRRFSDSDERGEQLKVHFVSNVDGAHLEQVLDTLDPGRTLFVIASKSFTTQETMLNARAAREWFLDQGFVQQEIRKHFVAVSTNQQGVEEFGIADMFVFWDWVGGRFSLWSAIGLPIALAVGFENFLELLQGAFWVDQAFRTTDFAANIPVLMGLLAFWYNNFWGYQSQAILPYAQDLEYLPAFLQQGEMESNGKQVDLDGQIVDYQTGMIIWGQPGTNGQHAFYQLLHQGTKIVPCEFIGFIKPLSRYADQHQVLLANMLAQSEALLKGKGLEEVRTELADRGLNEEQIDDLAPHRVFEGNRPSSTLLIDELSPRTLGMLIALYEHKIFVLGCLWQINSFDQWGVELGKQLAKRILPELQDKAAEENRDLLHDCSTANLLRTIKERSQSGVQPGDK